MGNHIGVFRYYDMTPYWNSERIDYPYQVMADEKKYVEVNENDIDKFFDLIPDVPILRMETHNFPKVDEEDLGCCPACLRLFNFDTMHYMLVLYTSIGVFMVDRYKDSIDISFQTDEQHHQYINKPNEERQKPYFDYKGRVRHSAETDKSFHGIIRVLKRNGSGLYNYLFNNCIQNTNSWFNAMKKKQPKKTWYEVKEDIAAFFTSFKRICNFTKTLV
jgi:hypothetical protein